MEKMKKLILAGVLSLALAGLVLAQQSAETATAEPSWAKEIEALVQAERGLQFKEPINYRLMNREQVVQYIQQKFRESMTPEKLRDSARAFALLGLLPEGYELEKELLELMAEQVGAFYDYPTKSLVNISDMQLGKTFQKATMAHEMVHVLQDQHFGFATFPQMKLKDNEDRQRAFQALFEGDATAIMPKVLIKTLGSNPLAVLPELMQAMNLKQEKLQAAPPFLKNSLLFPYTTGEKFVSTLIAQKNSYELVNKAFKDVPSSTEQIIHPEKYYDPAKRDEPKEVKLANLESPRWRLLENNVLGEFGIRELVSLTLAPPPPAAAAAAQNPLAKLTNPMGTTPPAPDAVVAAAGWGGDRFHVYAFSGDKNTPPGSEPLALWFATVWDTEEDAVEFNDTMVQVFQKRYPGLVVKEGPKGSGSLLLENNDWHIRITLKGTNVTIVQAKPAQFQEFVGLVDKAK